MIEYAAFLGTFVVLMIVSLFCIYNVFQGILEMLREFLEEINDERIMGNEEETEEIMRSGETARGTEFSGSNEEYQKKEKRQ